MQKDVNFEVSFYISLIHPIRFEYAECNSLKTTPTMLLIIKLKYFIINKWQKLYLYVMHNHTLIKATSLFLREESPLTEKGIAQARALSSIFLDVYGIPPQKYDRPVLASSYARSQQTAQYAGFPEIAVDPIIDESSIDNETQSMNGNDIIIKHRLERWVPESVRERASSFLGKIDNGELGYEIYFAHGMFIAAVFLECDVRSIAVPTPFHEKRGYVPLQASITKLEV